MSDCHHESLVGMTQLHGYRCGDCRENVYNIVLGSLSELVALRARVAELEAENAICRNAVEDVLEIVESIETRDLDDFDDGAVRASRRKLSEAIGKATPRLMMEKPEGQKFYGLLWREIRAENARLRKALENAPDTKHPNRTADYHHWFTTTRAEALKGEGHE